MSLQRRLDADLLRFQRSPHPLTSYSVSSLARHGTASAPWRTGCPAHRASRDRATARTGGERACSLAPTSKRSAASLARSYSRRPAPLVGARTADAVRRRFPSSTNNASSDRQSSPAQGLTPRRRLELAEWFRSTAPSRSRSAARVGSRNSVAPLGIGRAATKSRRPCACASGTRCARKYLRRPAARARRLDEDSTGHPRCGPRRITYALGRA
jgi:hypothetical protein